MRYTFLLLIFIIVITGCKKTKNCTNVTVTTSVSSCKHIGVILNGIKYPSDDLPDQYAIDGKEICIEYSFWDDPKLCVCCGGTKVHVISVN